ncbi:MAG: AMP-binding protein, partial [Pseudomonadota bacterium]
MQNRHYKVWPKGRPYELSPLKTSVFENLVISAARYPEHPAIIYYDNPITYQALLAEVQSVSAFLRSRLKVGRNERVLLYMQNCPQFIIAYYGILGANAVVVPVNPMSRAAELEHVAEDTGAVAIIAGQELAEHALPLIGRNALRDLIHVNYRDYISRTTDLELPDEVTTAPRQFGTEAAHSWSDATGHEGEPPQTRNKGSDWCVIPYSSGTTGRPKGCLHTHDTVNSVINAYANWNPIPPNAPILGSLPLFHVTGMQNSMNTPLFTGATIVLMTRWNKDVAGRLIERYRVAQWRAITTMIIDFISNPKIGDYDLSSLLSIGGGGAQLPYAVSEKLGALTGLNVTEGYG